MKNNIILEKSFKFALKIVEVYKELYYRKKEIVLSRQLLKSGTSIGANCQESIAAQSRKDFINKLYIALKEAHETHYWLRLLNESGYLTNRYDLVEDVNELIKILTSIIKTTQKKKAE